MPTPAPTMTPTRSAAWKFLHSGLTYNVSNSSPPAPTPEDASILNTERALFLAETAKQLLVESEKPKGCSSASWIKVGMC